MRISVRKFQRNASEYLEMLPLILTRYNRPIAKVIKANESQFAKLCEHGSQLGLCKYGCK